MPLAINSYKNLNTLTDGQQLLNLAWTLDEREYLSVDLESIISFELEEEIHTNLPYINSYFVKDPYGEDILESVVADFFSVTRGSYCVTCGAGVISLLHALAKLTASKITYMIGDTYPDFPFWVEQSKGKCIFWNNSNLSIEDNLKHLNVLGTSIFFLERPSLIGNKFSDLSELAELCEGASRDGTLVIVDESNANYYPPSFSAINLIHKVNNLIVVRGFSKAYGLGSLRLAYCVTSNRQKDKIRSVVPPLLVSSLSLRIGKKILGLGDITMGLRQRITETKVEMEKIFRAAQLREIVITSEYMPYLLLNNSSEYIQAHIERNGILGKSHPLCSKDTPNVSYIYRLSTPLNANRMELLRQKALLHH
jgi:histidinol-phosphate/aromatic aminotransferase/cobyric acid decarboxylase-like protein